MPFIYLDFHSTKLGCIRVDETVFSHDRKTTCAPMLCLVPLMGAGKRRPLRVNRVAWHYSSSFFSLITFLPAFPLLSVAVVFNWSVFFFKRRALEIVHNSLSLFFCGVCSKSKGAKGQKGGFIKLQRTEETGEEGKPKYQIKKKDLSKACWHCAFFSRQPLQFVVFFFFSPPSFPFSICSHLHLLIELFCHWSAHWLGLWSILHPSANDRLLIDERAGQIKQLGQVAGKETERLFFFR